MPDSHITTRTLIQGVEIFAQILAAAALSAGGELVVLRNEFDGADGYTVELGSTKLGWRVRAIPIEKEE